MKFRVIQLALPGVITPLPTLYDTDQLVGYDVDALNDWLIANFGPEKSKQFHEFMYGQTMAMYSDDDGDHGIVYRWDFARFMLRMPVID